MRLNKRNYFTNKNKHLTNSKVSDFLNDKELFHKKHIEGSVKTEPTDAMIFGSAVDQWLTVSKASFKRKYKKVTRRSKTISTKWENQIPEKAYDKIVDICERVSKSPAVKTLNKEFKSQEILQHKINLNHFEGIAGRPDWYKIDGEKCIIVDLKTTQSIDPNKYHWKCKDFGYYRQAAFYSLLLETLHGCREFLWYHLAIEKTYGQARMFELSPHEVMNEYLALDDLLVAVGSEKEFKNPLPSFETATMVGQASNVLLDEL